MTKPKPAKNFTDAFAVVSPRGRVLEIFLHRQSARRFAIQGEYIFSGKFMLNACQSSRRQPCPTKQTT